MRGWNWFLDSLRYAEKVLGMSLFELEDHLSRVTLDIKREMARKIAERVKAELEKLGAKARSVEDASTEEFIIFRVRFEADGDLYVAVISEEHGFNVDVFPEQTIRG